MTIERQLRRRRRLAELNWAWKRCRRNDVIFPDMHYVIIENTLGKFGPKAANFSRPPLNVQSLVRADSGSAGTREVAVGMNIVVVVSHSDEEAIRFGGTIAKQAKLGHRVSIICMVGKCYGHASMPLEQLWRVTEEELAASAKILGADYLMLDYQDQFIPDDAIALGRVLIDPLRALTPDVILTHDPTVLPCDQSNTARAVIVAATRVYLPLYVTEHPPIPIPDIYHLPEMNQRPDIYIDITDVIDVKIAAMRAHQSQIEAARDLYWAQCSMLTGELDVSEAEKVWVQQHLVREPLWGQLSGTQYAEAYVAYRSPLSMARKDFPTREEVIG